MRSGGRTRAANRPALAQSRPPHELSNGHIGQRLSEVGREREDLGNMTLTDSAVSSGYTSIVALTGTTALQVGDHGSNWCFAIGSGLHTVGIWARTIVLHDADSG